MTQKRRSFSLEDKINLCNRISNGESNKALAKELNVSHSTISSIWKKKDKYIQMASSITLKTKKLRKSKFSRRSFSLEDKINLCSRISNGESNKVLAKELKVSHSTISSIWKKKDKYIQMASSISLKTKKLRKSKFNNVESALLTWFKMNKNQNIALNSTLLLAKANEFAEEIGETGKISKSWIQRFCHRNDIFLRNMSEHVENAPQCVTNEWINTVWASLQRKYNPDEIYIANTMGLFYKLTPNKTLDFEGEKSTCSKYSKDRITILVCVNMSGSDKKKLLVIGRSKNPCFNKVKNLSVDYHSNENACMTSDIFNSFLLNWDKELQTQNKKVLLLVDNCQSHTELTTLQYIDVIFVPTDTTSIMQPMNQGVIQKLKFNFHQKQILQILLDAEKNRKTKISILDAILMVSKGWDEIPPMTIANFFCLGGLSNNEVQSDANDSILASWTNNLNFPLSVTPDIIEECCDVEYKVDTSGEFKENEMFSSLVQKKYDGNEEKDEEEPPSIEDALDSIRILQKFLLFNNNFQSDIMKQSIDAIEAKISHEYYIKKCSKQSCITELN